MIGIFDSGSGGLSVLREVLKLLPGEKFVYYADNANCPYGEKTPEFIQSRCRAITEYLLSRGARIIVVACNTATAAAITTLRNEYPVKFIGMEPAVKPAALSSKTGVIGVLATAGTLKGSKYLTTKGIYEDDVEIVEHVGQGFVELVENGILDGPQAVDMYEDPVLVDKTFDVAGKKIGYLAYSAFDLNSSQTLPDVFRRFKSENIDELILDLRYNGGGYAFTENVLASMIAPMANVLAGDIFQTEVYNSILAEAWKKQGEDTNTYFSTVHEISSQKLKIDVSDANPGISKVYVIVTGGTASASEGVIVGLKPYMDVELVGQRTYGKYCAGILLAPDQFYSSRYDYSLIQDWGMYVMISKFADCNGRNASIPDGIPVDLEAKDNPLDGYQLGDENETMLRAALQAAGKTYPKSASVTRSYSKAIDLTPLDHGAPRGILIRTDLPPLPLKIPVIPTSLQ